MKYLPLLLTVLLYTPSMLQAQNQQTIEVEGQSELKVMPNQALVHINILEKALKASDASQKLNQTSNRIIDKLKEDNIPSYEVNASNYMVQINRIYGKGTSRDSGYVASQTLVVRINDIDRSLIQVMEALGTFQALNYNVGFQLSEELRKSKQDELLEMALEDARQKAMLIAHTLGLGDIQVQKVNYSTQHNTFPGPIMRVSADISMEQAKAAPVFLPEEQTLSDRVLVSFRF